MTCSQQGQPESSRAEDPAAEAKADEPEASAELAAEAVAQKPFEASAEAGSSEPDADDASSAAEEMQSEARGAVVEDVVQVVGHAKVPEPAAHVNAAEETAQDPSVPVAVDEELCAEAPTAADLFAEEIVDSIKPLIDATTEDSAADVEECRQVEEPADESAQSEPTSEAAIAGDASMDAQSVAEAAEAIAAHALKTEPCAKANDLEADAVAKADGPEETANASEIAEGSSEPKDLWTPAAEVEELHAEAPSTDLAVHADAMAAEEAAEVDGWFSMPQGHSAEEAAEEQEPTASDEAAEDPSMPTAEDVLEQFADAIAEEEAAELDELQAAEETAEKPTASEEVAQDPSTPAAEDEVLRAEAPSTNPAAVEEMVDILKPLADAQAEEAAVDLEEWVAALKQEPCAEETTTFEARAEASILEADAEAKTDGSEEIASTSEMGEEPDPIAPEAKAQDLWTLPAEVTEEAAEVDGWFAMPQGHSAEEAAEEQEPTASDEAAEDPSMPTAEDVLEQFADAIAEEEAAELDELQAAEETAEKPTAPLLLRKWLKIPARPLLRMRCCVRRPQAQTRPPLRRWSISSSRWLMPRPRKQP